MVLGGGHKNFDVVGVFPLTLPWALACLSSATIKIALMWAETRGFGLPARLLSKLFFWATEPSSGPYETPL